MNQRPETTNSFWQGLGMVVRGLSNAAQEASYKLGFGSAAFGASFEWIGNATIGQVCIAVGAFLIGAMLGDAVDHKWGRARRAKRFGTGETCLPSRAPKLLPGIGGTYSPQRDE